MEINTAGFTVNPVDPVTLPEVALMLAVPGVVAVASPALLIETIDGLADDQLTAVVRSFVLPSLYVPVALNCCVCPFATTGFAGVTAMLASVGGAAVTATGVERFMVP
jgi:hypothetical protein